MNDPHPPADAAAHLGAAPAPRAALPLSLLLNHCADAVQAVLGGESLTAALARCPAPARPGAQALSFHALRWLGTARALRARLAPKPPAAAVDALLLSTLALLWPTADAPYAPHTLVDQAVDAARQRAPQSAGFVNAVLRRFLRERDALAATLAGDPVAQFNHPAWWMERLRRDWPDRCQAILQADNQHPPMSLRVNARRGSAADYLARLASAGLAATLTGAHAITLATPCAVTRLPGFAEGDVSVQDVAAQRAAPLLLGIDPGDTPLSLGIAAGDTPPFISTPAGASGPASSPPAWRLAPGARVLDACAAPGGKTAHLLELADLDLLAIDSDPSRLERVHDTLRRLGLTARTAVGDAGAPATWWDGRPFDAVLLDAPCSAAGIVRRHPDVRWLRRATDIADLAALQARLLDALWPLLAPGGRLLYCTCSVFKAEGQDQIDAFLQRQPRARRAAQPVSPGHLLPLPDNAEPSDAEARAPSEDGFFYALLEKT